jgi:copper chaperone CopZ
MKNQAIKLLIVMLLSSIGVMAQENKKKELTPVYLTCEMDCHSCEQKITELLKFEKGIRDLKADFVTNTVFVAFKPGSNSAENIIKALEKKGYKSTIITKKAYDEKLKSKDLKK